MPIRGIRGLVLGAVVCCAVVSRADASLDGHTLTTTGFHGTAPDMTAIVGPVDSVVGPGVELASFGWSSFVSIDFSDMRIRITLNTDQPFGYFEVLRFTDTNGTIPDFTAVSIDPSTSYAGFDASRIHFTADLIDLNLTALYGLQGQQIVLDLSGSPVPLDIPVDIRPGGCANVLPTTSTNLLPVAIPGGPTFDPSRIDPASIRLRGVAAVGARLADASGAECGSGPDGSLDLLVAFRIPEIVATLGAVTHGETRALVLTGELEQEFGGTAVQGEDVVVLLVPR